ncbi:phage holin family protein [Caldifermentibacillus hisashii]|uniref:phage holin family protein n=1 Tax=Caldifermentibacillus hisashii TaxID=996558 RepID=UPI003423C191
MESMYKVTMTVLGGILGYLWGGWSTLLGILLAFVILDYVTGIFAAAMDGSLSSKVGFKAIPKKIVIFIMVSVGNLVDIALGGDNHVFRDGVIFFYLANELLSIIENTGRIGLPVPDFIKNAVQVLKGKGEDK